MNDDVTLWGIHAGKTGDADQLFKTKDVVALGWHGTPDLAPLPDEREAFKSMCRKTFPDAGDGKPVTSARQLYRFVYQMQTP